MYAIRSYYDELVEMMGARGTAWGRFQENHILNQVGSAHKRLRDVLAPAFTPRRANQHRPLMREVISELLDEWAPKGEFDFEEFASCFPRITSYNVCYTKLLRTSATAVSLAKDWKRYSPDQLSIPNRLNSSFALPLA